MEKTEKPLLERPERQFSTEVAMVLLISFVFIELASMVGWSPGLTSGFPHPMDEIVGLVAFIIGLSGAYGLLRENKVGAYFALLASVFWMVLGCFSLVKAYGTSQLNLALVTHATTALVLGPLTLICIFKSSLDQQKTMNQMLGAGIESIIFPSPILAILGVVTMTLGVPLFDRAVRR